jgi:hypothetical protein
MAHLRSKLCGDGVWRESTTTPMGLPPLIASVWAAAQSSGDAGRIVEPPRWVVDDDLVTLWPSAPWTEASVNSIPGRTPIGRRAR